MIASLNQSIIIVITLFLLSCGGGDDEGASGTGSDADRPEIRLSMTEDLLLTISTKKFSDVGTIRFDLEYNYNSFDFPNDLLTTSSESETISEYENMLQFAFYGDFDGEINLTTIQFTGNATEGEVGAIITSHVSNVCLNSSIIRVRTFWAFK